MSRRKRLLAQDGVSLVELITVVAVSSVVLAFVTGTVIHALRSQDRQTTQVQALNDARLTLERTTRDLRAADPLRLAEPNRVRLDVGAGAGTPRTVTYERVSENLVVTDASTGQSRVLVSGLEPTQPVFEFHLFDGSTAGTGVTVDPRSVQSITIRLQVEAERAGRVVDLENRVLLRNADD